MPSATLLDEQLGSDAKHSNATIRIVRRLLIDFQGAIALRLWNGAQYVFGPTVPKFTLVVRDPAVLRRLVMKRNPITLVDAYFRGLVDFEGDLYAGLHLKPYLQKLSLPIRSRVAGTAANVSSTNSGSWVESAVLSASEPTVESASRTVVSAILAESVPSDEAATATTRRDGSVSRKL